MSGTQAAYAPAAAGSISRILSQLIPRYGTPTVLTAFRVSMCHRTVYFRSSFQLAPVSLFGQLFSSRSRPRPFEPQPHYLVWSPFLHTWLRGAYPHLLLQH